MRRAEEGHTVPVTAAVWIRGGRVLAVRRPPGKRHAGMWEFPGGKVERGESLIEALGRELTEELGVELEAATPWRTLRHSYPGLEVELFFFLVTSCRGEPKGVEGQTVAWLSPEEVAETPFLQADKDLLPDVVALLDA